MDWDSKLTLLSTAGFCQRDLNGTPFSLYSVNLLDRTSYYDFEKLYLC